MIAVYATVVLGGLFIAIYVGSLLTLVLHTGPTKRFACWMGWHSWPHFDPVGWDGASTHARCRWCGYTGMIDSQGNLF